MRTATKTIESSLHIERPDLKIIKCTYNKNTPEGTLSLIITGVVFNMLKKKKQIT